MNALKESLGFNFVYACVCLCLHTHACYIVLLCVPIILHMINA